MLNLKKSEINIIPVNGEKPVISGSVYPLKLPPYIINSISALKKNDVRTFVAYYLNENHEAMPLYGLSPLNGPDALAERRVFAAALEKAGHSDVYVNLLP